SFWLCAITVLHTAQIYPPLKIFICSSLSRFRNQLALDAYKGKTQSSGRSVTSPHKKEQHQKFPKFQKPQKSQRHLRQRNHKNHNNNRNTQSIRNQNTRQNNSKKNQRNPSQT